MMQMAAGAGATPTLRVQRTSVVSSPLQPQRALKAGARTSRAAAAPTRAAAGGASTALIKVQGLHLPMTPAIKSYAEEKAQKAIANFDGSIKEVDVKLSVRGKSGKSGEAHHQRDQIVEVTVYTLRHGVIRVEDTEDDLYAAIDLVTDKLKRKMGKVKERAIQKNTWPGRGGSKGGAGITDALDGTDPVTSLPAAGTAGPVPEVVREKVFLLEPMSTAEALDQLEAVGHDFYVYADAADGVTKVVYRRKSHGYGVIIPQQP